jgi:ADP-ribose pyrophosphatase YjhB (NUDIX family)
VLRAPHPGEPARRQCERCGRILYQNSKPTACALVVRHGCVLLVRRAIPPALGQWDIPGGFLEAGERPEAGVVRELREETGLDITITRLLGLYIGEYVYGDEAASTLDVVYVAGAPSGEPVAADDASEVGWFTPEELPTSLAFAHQPAILEDWRKTL